MDRLRAIFGVVAGESESGSQGKGQTKKAGYFSRVHINLPSLNFDGYVSEKKVQAGKRKFLFRQASPRVKLNKAVE